LAGIHYVNDNAPGADTGTSWFDAFRDLQAALDVAVPGDEIWVANGNYEPPAFSTPFSLPDGVKIYGGFDGTESTLAERAELFCETVLNGDLENDDHPVADWTDNARHVVIVAGTSLGVELNGFTITGGDADTVNTYYAGGGMLVDATQLGTTVCKISNCIFRNNRAGSGGALSIQGSMSSVEVEDCEFLWNEAYSVATTHGFAGAVSAHSVSSPSSLVFKRCLFKENTSAKYGGAFSQVNSLVEFHHCRFHGNIAAEHSGAGNSAIYVNCEFAGNEAAHGGAIAASTGTEVIHCSLVGNTATGQGGGLYVSFGEVHIVGSVFRDNVDSGSDVEDAQICIEAGAGVTVNKSCVQAWSFTKDPIGECNTGANPLLAELPDDGGDGWSTRTNNDYGDLRLLAGSPCMDRGSRVALETVHGVLLDLDGNPRFVEEVSAPDCGLDLTPLPDAGAYEGVHAPPCQTLALEINPPEVPAFDPLNFQICGGQPGGWVVLFVWSVDGVPLVPPFLILASASVFDGNGRSSWGVPQVPPGLNGIQAGIRAAGVDASGSTVFSAEQTLTLCPP
jgi:hypothetical protein